MVYEKIKQILCEEFDVDELDITIDARIEFDLGLDELDVADLTMDIEDEFGVEITFEDLEDIKTVGDLVNHIENNKE